ncbi:hydrolase [Pilimelia terevasa]|uniref:Hydrolase n=1 Tax=Pilimelia terevasa TaxID=53372 RepID=A0A8J3BTW4_9ACTN|nr:isochorismatase family cysteine hydrolase [Pilimelia terevasa]GGK43015.1 hydrolase [Pilimelia terevasa]
MTGGAVLVVVDVQNGFVREQSRAVVPAVVDLVGKWQAAGGDTVFTRFVNRPGSPYDRLIGWTRLMVSPETDLVDPLRPFAGKAGLVVEKPAYTAFVPEMEAAIRAAGWSDLFLCGLATESCVCKTAVDAFERGLTPWVVADACGSHAGRAAHEAGLLVIRRFIGAGQVITADQALTALTSRPRRV